MDTWNYGYYGYLELWILWIPGTMDIYGYYGYLEQLNTFRVIRVFDICPCDALFQVFFLFEFEYMLVEVGLKVFVS